MKADVARPKTRQVNSQLPESIFFAVSSPVISVMLLPAGVSKSEIDTTRQRPCGNFFDVVLAPVLTSGFIHTRRHILGHVVLSVHCRVRSSGDNEARAN